ncbi:uncharacterized protein [Physcomitrium patens]|uniref:Uncharacterized protein n=1 Tax=Physcomitrium patens TaxID=3218 RepID=A0A2K1JKW8_PHYPA|nr:uncharacterized protein LOC112290820 [Physcomitrium patens]XP_024393314.1 uncharacterized protein LOC112290820 [Physcomitrium patens]XP_024393315.1 uncharacterized protein LOC112290820 [Physcomitrium patens]XP_024393316.1 uncharacterized protein LOC112290820 [Physcomitrium patens]PNR42190.1 hypothetical protein PHYPA_017019 [Physcomitrium patens]|eukprot:XP_024393313.1 uncharacterized protein LOC112290820 [Physcomitrella patens]
MGRDSGSLIGGKRSRPADDEAYFDNFHNHKRYLTEVMASSLNGLRVGESTSQSQRSSPPLIDNMVSPAHTETAGLSRSASSFPTSHGDDLSTLDSPMSDDSDESVGFRMGRASEIPVSTLESVSVTPTSPVSPRRKEHFPPYIPNYSSTLSSRQQTPPPYTPSLPLPCSQARAKGTDEGRLPPSPNDPCQSADLRRAALLRSLQMRSQSPIKPASSTVAPEKGAEKGVVPEGLEEGGDQSSPGSSEHTGCNCEDMGLTSTTIFPPISTRAATRVRSLLLDEPVVAATMALSSTLPQSTPDADSDTGAQESRFEPKSSQPKSLLRSCSKLARTMSSDVIVSDAESKPLRRPSAATEKACKRAKPY